MKKFFKVLKRIFVSIFLTLYFSVILIASTLLLTRNDYGVTQIKDKVLILMSQNNANNKYKNGDLVILDKRDINDLKVGDEIFTYQPNKKDKSVDIVIAEISAINLETKSPYVTLKNTETSWGEDYIAGTASKSYHKIGKIISIIENKWIFLLTLIIPCFFILLYEIYLLIITIKYGDEDEEEIDSKEHITSKEEKVVPKKEYQPKTEILDFSTIQSPKKSDNDVVIIKEQVTSNQTISDDDKLIDRKVKSSEVIILSEENKTHEEKLNNLAKELAELKQQISENKVDNSNDRIDELMKELNALKQNKN